MSQWKFYSDSIDTDVGSANYNTYRQSEKYGYLAGYDDENPEEASHFVRITNLPETPLWTSNRELAAGLKDPNNISWLLAEGYADFPLTENMDSDRVIENIQATLDNGLGLGHAMNRALLTEYGIVGVNGEEFAHRYGFDELVEKMNGLFPDGPPMQREKRSDGTSLSVSINTQTGVVGSILKSPPKVDGYAAVTRLADATVGRANLWETPKI